METLKVTTKHNAKAVRHAEIEKQSYMEIPIEGQSSSERKVSTFPLLHSSQSNLPAESIGSDVNFVFVYFRQIARCSKNRQEAGVIRLQARWILWICCQASSWLLRKAEMELPLCQVTSNNLAFKFSLRPVASFRNP